MLCIKGHAVCKNNTIGFHFSCLFWCHVGSCSHVQKVTACKSWFSGIPGLLEPQKSKEMKQYPSEPTVDLTVMGHSGGMGVWSSLQRDITVNYITAVYRGNADCCAHRFLLAVQLFTISQGTETGLVWLLLHTWCRLKHSFLETDDFDVVVNKWFMSALPLVWCICFTLASS